MIYFSESFPKNEEIQSEKKKRAKRGANEDSAAAPSRDPNSHCESLFLFKLKNYIKLTNFFINFRIFRRIAKNYDCRKNFGIRFRFEIFSLCGFFARIWIPAPRAKKEQRGEEELRNVDPADSQSQKKDKKEGAAEKKNEFLQFSI